MPCASKPTDDTGQHIARPARRKVRRRIAGDGGPSVREPRRRCPSLSAATIAPLSLGGQREPGSAGRRSWRNSRAIFAVMRRQIPAFAARGLHKVSGLLGETAERIGIEHAGLRSPPGLAAPAVLFASPTPTPGPMTVAVVRAIGQQVRPKRSEALPSCPGRPADKPRPVPIGRGQGHETGTGATACARRPDGLRSGHLGTTGDQQDGRG